MVEVWRVILAIVCVCFSGIFAGLTLGMLTLDLVDLRVIAESGTLHEREQARRVMSVRKHGNFLLCTLLTGNTASNALFSILTAELTSGLTGFVISTLAILFIAEITPQSICHRFGLRIGAATVWLVKMFMILLTPIAFPTSRILDYFLGTEPITRYNKRALKALVNIQTQDGALAAAAAAAAQAQRSQKAPKTRHHRRKHRHGARGAIATTAGTSRLVNGDQASANNLLGAGMKRIFGNRSSNDESDEGATMGRNHAVGSVNTTTFGSIPTASSPTSSKAAAGAFPDLERGAARRSTEAERRMMTRSFETSVIDERDSANIVAGAIGATYAAATSKANTEQITLEESVILSGALEFAAKTVEQIMTPLSKVFMLSANDRLNFKTMTSIFQSGHSRVPVYLERRPNIIGVIFTKDLILIDPDDGIPVSAILLLFRRELRRVMADVHLNVLLNEFKTGRGHLAIVQRSGDTDAVGIATLEDVIEEIIQSEIVDETDVYRDNVRDEVVVRKRRIDTDLLRMLDSTPRHETRLTPGETSIIASFLANNFAKEFGESRMSFHQLEHMLANCSIAEYDRPGAPIVNNPDSDSQAWEATASQGWASEGEVPISDTVEPEQDPSITDKTEIDDYAPRVRSRRSLNARERRLWRGTNGSQADGSMISRRLEPLVSGSADDLIERPSDLYIYKRGVPSHHATLILSGHVEIMWDRRQRITEAGPWTLLARDALDDELYVADFTARGVEFPLRLLRIPTRHYRRSLRMSMAEKEAFVSNRVSGLVQETGQTS
ncbi:Metal transporter cnnm2 [Cyanidiococcus yangmingshanensis]|uniref:Metal transporter cnnm2 n=1 Tax=Cyanidiococcus yangmingshanensis TaxID=2690220 RepID=A0A7J7IFV6_9RHOD|nr:Metal transporter cnnm2 [Cyanidiococcus yangmingshanensis]